MYNVSSVLVCIPEAFYSVWFGYCTCTSSNKVRTTKAASLFITALLLLL